MAKQTFLELVFRSLSKLKKRCRKFQHSFLYILPSILHSYESDADIGLWMTSMISCRCFPIGPFERASESVIFWCKKHQAGNWDSSMAKRSASLSPWFNNATLSSQNATSNKPKEVVWIVYGMGIGSRRQPEILSLVSVIIRRQIKEGKACQSYVAALFESYWNKSE